MESGCIMRKNRCKKQKERCEKDMVGKIWNLRTRRENKRCERAAFVLSLPRKLPSTLLFHHLQLSLKRSWRVRGDRKEGGELWKIRKYQKGEVIELGNTVTIEKIYYILNYNSFCFLLYIIFFLIFYFAF